MTRLKAYFSAHCAQIWKGSFLLLLFVRIFYYELIGRATVIWLYCLVFLVAPTVVIGCVAFLVSSGVLSARGQRRKVVAVILVLLLPWTSLYETARFWVLRPVMETVATQTANAYRDAPLEESGVQVIALRAGERILSRFGSVVLIPREAGIEIAFTKYQGGLFTGTREYVFCTGVSYAGARQEVWRDTYIAQKKPIYKGWTDVKTASVAEILTT